MADLSGYRCLIAVNHLHDIPENLEITFGDISISVAIQILRWQNFDEVDRHNAGNECTVQHTPLERTGDARRRHDGSDRGRLETTGGSSSSDASWNSSEIRDRRRSDFPQPGCLASRSVSGNLSSLAATTAPAASSAKPPPLGLRPVDAPMSTTGGEDTGEAGKMAGGGGISFQNSLFSISNFNSALTSKIAPVIRDVLVGRRTTVTADFRLLCTPAISFTHHQPMPPINASLHVGGGVACKGGRLPVEEPLILGHHNLTISTFYFQGLGPPRVHLGPSTLDLSLPWGPSPISGEYALGLPHATSWSPAQLGITNQASCDLEEPRDTNEDNPELFEIGSVATLASFTPSPAQDLHQDLHQLAIVHNPRDPPRSSTRLSNRRKDSSLNIAMSRKARLLEGDLLDPAPKQRRWATKKIVAKSQLCGVLISDDEAADIQKLMYADA